MDETIFLFLNGLISQTPFLNVFFLFCAEYLGWFLIGGVVAFLFCERIQDPLLFFIPRREHVRELSIIFFTALAAWFFVHFLKDIFAVPRPFMVLDGVNLLFVPDGTSSFPSGHATFFSALALGLYFYHRRLAYLYGVGAILIGVSRIAVGVHWPFDIVGGFLLGSLIAYAVHLFYKKKNT